MFLPERKRQKTQATAPILAKAAALCFFFSIPLTGAAASASKAIKDYSTGKYERALHQYQDLLEKKPNDPKLNFNAGDAAFQSGFYDKALKHFNSSLATEDLGLQEQSFYNLGNTQYRLGEEGSDPSKKQENWEHAVNSYESALKLNANDADAKHNLQLVKKKLEELKQQQQQQKQNKDGDKNDKDKDQQNQDKDKQQEQKDKDKQQQDQQKQDQQKQDQQKQQDKDQQKPDQQKQDKPEDQQQAQKPDDKQKDQQDSQKQQQPKPGEEEDQDQQEPQEPGKQRKIQMTPQQAMRLLEAVKNDERTLIFIPPIRPIGITAFSRIGKMRSA